MKNADEITITREKIKGYINNGLYGEAVNTINGLTPELKDNVLFLSGDDLSSFLCGLECGTCFGDCEEGGCCTVCGCILCGLGIASLCCGTGCVDGICDGIRNGAVDFIESVCCNCCC